ncbi:MAG: radical SAM protein [bacterium (Candidatus Ratteibacteria) CG_4_10_14_3_um_filter_41_18]|uniref:Radical SAM protein n=4 Tax=Candidatus Ratteibacteria TaxID=2979319 RepID=A0A2M7E8R0_9BACT|nr:MAG: hypothetical protein AUJ76_03380 [Candidatus Omnitrophica bacterium CG1_02_41_171]PIV64132.1 MAG: radical SAM protein [bacterium (Candidatus Ratteibacteria) CG01_land_8_20_14_3_00_40_19]PIW33860.1 MAG: radical SAM protein [bacterium (Candidatus Ratteibacteria) CG15_BIG_FIL_POST_REV_8_21_14_020_41_12]PIW74367.1 MAG: radical SAM protein [bacterium (Candidatus Ratteibacteria) CG_4_8_14_3_um_filter_41_36]PIX77383.1 MAG: radical SAM protein [bacterium (Candidatus Ratteibacteria) CG_4_10_14_3
MKSYVFGPVPSRRLGFSLGIDTIPYKTCSLDCVYCQLGRTLKKTIKTKECVSSSLILKQLKKVISSGRKIDYLTFSGSGEPTLNSKIGEMISEIKKITEIPVAVLTNGTLLFKKKIRENLKKADLVIPSLDAVSSSVFEKINRPYSSLKIDKIISGLTKFREEFDGKIFLEIMLVSGVNDNSQELKKLKAAINLIRPDKVQLNSPVRPPAEEWVKPVSLNKLKNIKKLFGKNCEIIIPFKRKKQTAYQKDLEKEILALLSRRPVTALEISNVLGAHLNEVVKYLEVLEKKKRINSKIHQSKRYYGII